MALKIIIQNWSDLMNKPANQYRPGSSLEKLYNGDWSRCTAQQIADALSCMPQTVQKYMVKIKAETGYVIPYLRMSGARKTCVAVEPTKLPPSYRPKKEAVPRKCSTCGNTDCAGRCRAVCWTDCREWMPLEENQEAVP